MLSQQLSLHSLAIRKNGSVIIYSNVGNLFKDGVIAVLIDSKGKYKGGAILDVYPYGKVSMSLFNHSSANNLSAKNQKDFYVEEF